MKVYINRYRDHWFSPNTWVDYAFFWTAWSRCNRDTSLDSALDKDRVWHDRPEWADRLADRLVPVAQGIQWILDRVHPRIEYVKIDRWDTWSMDSTLAAIVLPMLKQLKATKHGSPMVEDEDVPKHLHSTAAPARENEWDIDDNYHARWDWVMDEMIFAFEMKARDDWTSEFHSGEIDIRWVPVDADNNPVDKKDAKWHRMERGPRDTHVYDAEGARRVQERIANGFRLFGKYYEGLWD